jgi:pimeloyl-ACP methyl ester carboxylesterase
MIIPGWRALRAAMLSSALAATAGAAEPAAPPLALADCTIGEGDLAARCAVLEVPEDPAAVGGRRIPLRIAVLPAREAPAAGAVFVLAGGPGTAATEDAPGLVEFLEGVRRRRDLVFVDQRGTGGSNRLDCSPAAPDDAQSLLGDPARRLPLASCRRQLGRRADLRLYTTPIAMADLEAVRGALGYPAIDLLGYSYGAAAAQVYMRQRPERVRSAVLIAAAPLAPDPILFYARDAERALRRLFADCAAEPGCGAAFPDLGDDLAAVLARLERQPVQVTVEHPGTGRPAAVTFDRDAFVAALRTRLYGLDAAARVPRAVHRAAHGDFADMARAAVRIGWAQRRAMAWGMFFSVVCAEGLAELDAEAIARLSRGTFLGPGPLLAWRRACDDWPRGSTPPGHFEPLRVATPALLVTGDLDPVLPPYWAEQVAAFLPHARLVVVASASHFPDSPCVAGLVAAFLEAGSAAGLDARCAAAGSRPPFAS